MHGVAVDLAGRVRNLLVPLYLQTDSKGVKKVMATEEPQLANHSGRCHCGAVRQALEVLYGLFCAIGKLG